MKRACSYNLIKNILLFLLLSISLLVNGCGGSGSGGQDSGDGGTPGGGVFPEDTGFIEPGDSEIYELDGVTIEAVKDEVIVTFKNDASQDEINEVVLKIKDLNGEIIGGDKDLKTLQVLTSDPVSVVTVLKDYSGVAMSGLNQIAETDNANDDGYQRFLNEYTLSNKLDYDPFNAVSVPDLSGDWWISQINADKAWDITTGDSSIVIGVVDTGMMSGQEILTEDRISRYDYKGGSLTSDDSWDLKSGHHGLWVTGYAAGFIDDPTNYNNVSGGKNVRGVNHKTKVVMVDVGVKDGSWCIPFTELCWKKFLTITNVMQGIKTAIDKGACVVNVSIGSNTKDCGDDNCRKNRQQHFRSGLEGAINYGREKNSLIVFAAGNDKYKSDDVLFNTPDEEMEDKWSTNTIVVGSSTDDSGNLIDSDFSRMGAVIDLLAPGEAVGFSQEQVNVITSSHTGDGTSYAAPLVTGSCGMVKAINSTLLPPEVKHLIINTAPTIVSTSHSPNKHLDLLTALKSAKLTDGIELVNNSEVVFTKLDEEKSLDVKFTVPDAGISALDILFIVDVSGSFSDDIDTLQVKANEIIDDLNARGMDVQFGVACFSDFPISPYGELASGDKAFDLKQVITDSEDAVKSAIDILDQPLLYGNDSEESQLEALYQAVTGSGRAVPGHPEANIPAQSVGWREGAQKLIILATDAPFHDSAVELDYPGPTFDETITQLKDKKVIVVGLDSGSTQGDLEAVTEATEGLFFQLSSDSAEIAQKIKEAVDAIQSQVDISTVLIAGDDFVESFIPKEEYEEVSPGTEIVYTLTLKNHKKIGFFDQNYIVVIWYKADDSLIRREVYPVTINASK